MIIEKIKLFFARKKIYKGILYILLIILGLYCLAKLYNNYYAHISETSKVVIGTVFGAFIGGFFTLFGTLMINKSTQKASTAIKRKNIVYKPLYDELMEIHYEVLKNNPYPSHVEFEKKAKTTNKIPEYTVWRRISMDTRFFEVPQKLKDAMCDLYKAIEVYQDKYKKAEIVLDKLYREAIYEIAEVKIPDKTNVGSVFLSDVLSGNRPDNDILLWLNKSADDNQADKMWHYLINSVNCNDELKCCIETKKEWEKKEEYVINMLGVYIQYIIEKYEG